MPAVKSDLAPLTAGLLLAAGQGRRLGRGPKAFVQLGGETLLERAVARLRRVGVDAVVAGLPPGPDPVPLPADLIGQVNRVEPVDDELIPPLRQFTAGHRVECLAGLVDRRVTLRELGHGFGQLLLFGSQRDRHRGPPTGAAGRRVSWKNSAASSMASGVGRGFQPSSETALE